MKRLLFLAGLVLAVACGGSQARSNLFSTNWEDDGGQSIGALWQRISSSPLPESADIVVGVSAQGDKLIAMPIGGGRKWTFQHALDTRPVVAGSVVVGSGGGEVFAVEAASGNLLWKRPTGGLPMLGAGDDGSVTVITFRKAGGEGSVLLAVGHDGQVVRQIETEKPLGSPALLGRLAFVPWAGQYVSVIDLTSGEETARVTLREQISRAWVQSGSLWFGEVGYVRFDDHIRDASRGRATVITFPTRELPGGPKLMASGAAPVPASSDATDRVRLYARPAASDAAVAGGHLEDNRWYATYFRIAMGFGAEKGKLAWVHLHGTDFLGGAAGPGGVVLCDESGKTVMLDAKTGGALGEADLGEPLKACVVNMDAQRIAGRPDPKPLAEQLSEAVRVDAPQLVSAQRMLLRELAAVEPDLGTKTLIDVASDPRTSPDLLGDARIAIAGRRNGASYMEAALAKHYDFLHDVLRPPPVGPIAQALGAMKEKGAAAALASHLFNPADTDDDVRQAAAALAVVASPAELTSLQQFFGMYRATAPTDDIASAVASTGEALLTLGDVARVDSAVKDASTVALARQTLTQILAERAAKQAPAEPAPKKK